MEVADAHGFTHLWATHAMGMMVNKSGRNVILNTDRE